MYYKTKRSREGVGKYAMTNSFKTFLLTNDRTTRQITEKP